MTVKHFRNLQRAQMTAGFSNCMNEVTLFLSTCEGVDTEVHTRVLGHLVNCMTQINAMHDLPGAGAAPPPPSGPSGPQHSPFALPLVPIPGGAAPPPGSAPCKLGSQAGEAAKVFGGFQVVPAPASLPSSSPTGPSLTAARSSRSTLATVGPQWVLTQGHLPAAPRSLRTPCGGRGSGHC